MVSVRERIAIVFMTMSVIATLVLGGAVAYDLSRPRTRTIVSSAGSNAATATATDDTAPVDTGGGGPTPGSPTAPTASGPAARTGAVTAAAAASKKSTTASAGQLSTGSEGVSGDTITVGGIYDETGPLDATVERD